MAKLAEQLERKAFSAAIDVALRRINKDREKGLLEIVDLTEKFMGDNFTKEAYEGARAMIKNPDHKWMRYVNRLLDETDPHVAKMTALNLGYQAAFYGTKTIRKMREVHDCNIPWLILMDPTSACNLHCTGCWAAEYGHKLNLTFEELDSIVTQGKELGIYFYMMTGGEPLVRKADVIKLCEKHNDVAFHCYTNGTLVDQAFCDEMKRVGKMCIRDRYHIVRRLRRLPHLQGGYFPSIRQGRYRQTIPEQRWQWHQMYNKGSNVPERRSRFQKSHPLHHNRSKAAATAECPVKVSG